MYNNVAPSDKPKTTNSVPIHFPKMNPPTKKIGVPNPKSRTHIIVKTKKITEAKNKLLSFADIKY